MVYFCLYSLCVHTCSMFLIIGEVANMTKQAGTELGQAQLKLELELSFTWFKFCWIKLNDINTTGYFDCH